MSFETAIVDIAAQTCDFAHELATETIGRAKRAVEIVPGVAGIDP